MILLNYLSRFIIFIICISLINSEGFAILSIDIDNGNVQPINIAIAGLEYNHKIESVIINDLNNCSLFKVVTNNPEKAAIESYPDFDLWIKNDINFLVTAKISQDEEIISIKYRVWNLFNRKHVFGKEIKITKENWQQLSHTMADDIYEAGTGDKGYFNTQILYIAEIDAQQDIIKRIAIMDYDGANHHYLTDGSNMVLTPKMSPDNKKIMYMSFTEEKKTKTLTKKNPKVHIYDRPTGIDRIIGNFDGMTSAPRFGYSTNIGLLALSKDGHTNIYKFDINTSDYKQLTDNKYINTSPSYSPDNQFIVFNSDRSGSPQLYVMRNDGSDQKRISTLSGSYFSPVWSPKGDYIAFIKILSGTFYVGIMRPNGTEEKILASGHMIESPTWAPNGRLLIFTTTSKGTDQNPRKSKLYVVDITGKYHKLIETKENATDPMWSTRTSFD
jgi:TolB protein